MAPDGSSEPSSSEPGRDEADADYELVRPCPLALDIDAAGWQSPSDEDTAPQPAASAEPPSSSGLADAEAVDAALQETNPFVLGLSAEVQSKVRGLDRETAGPQVAELRRLDEEQRRLDDEFRAERRQLLVNYQRRADPLAAERRAVLVWGGGSTGPSWDRWSRTSCVSLDSGARCLAGTQDV